MNWGESGAKCIMWVNSLGFLVKLMYKEHKKEHIYTFRRGLFTTCSRHIYEQIL